MSDLVELFDHPPLHEPALLLALEGWIDAGAAAAGAIRSILATQSSEPIAAFDPDQLLDHRARRPMVTLEEGVVTDMAWPTTELRAFTDAAGRHVVALVGAEPDHSWRRFVDAVHATAMGLGVRTVVGLGAYPAPVPHTRDAHLALTSPSADLLDSFTGFVRGSVIVPAGVQTAVEVSLHEAGVPAIGLWAQVPHYISGIPYPAASLALVRGLEQVAGLVFETSQLAAESLDGRRQLDELVEANDQHRAMVGQLEELYDSQNVGGLGGLGPLPTADELAEEFQAFLRDQRE
jgi:predicted ATP-grasp superfamily ATP-dependent carboligase